MSFFTLNPNADGLGGTVLTISGVGTTTGDTTYLNQNLGFKDIGNAFDVSLQDVDFTLASPIDFIGSNLQFIRLDNDGGGGDDFAFFTAANTPVNTVYNLSGRAAVNSLPFSLLNVGNYTSSVPGQNDASLAVGGFDLVISNTPVSFAAVPEPATIGVLGLAVLYVVAPAARRRPRAISQSVD